MELPNELKAAIKEAASGEPLQAPASGLSIRYRKGEQGKAGYINDEKDALAYAAYRMPATYAAAYSVLRETRERMPGFAPRALLDAGAGTGTASWAAAAQWPELDTITLLERDADMTTLGRRLAAQSPSPALRDGSWIDTDLTGNWHAEHADIAMLCYALGELPEDKQEAAVKKLWDASETLVVVEPGTPAGFARIARVRGILLEAGAKIAAPCPGNVNCPEAEGGWCHFSARVARSRLHRQAKGAELSYEDEKYSYLIATKAECSPCAVRVLRHPKICKGYVELELCTEKGLGHEIVSKRMGDAYREARDLKWGEAMPPHGGSQPFISTRKLNGSE